VALPLFHKYGRCAAHGSSFVSSLDPLTLAERFSAFPQFRQVLLVPDGLSLSGIEADRHWLAQIRAASSGSEGDVSVLDFAGESVSAMHLAAEVSWLAAHARPLLHQRHPAKIASGNEGRRQYIYMVNMAAGELGRFMATRLQLDGWLAASMPVSLDSQTWRKGPVELFIHIEPSMKGTLLYVQIQSN